MSKNAISVKELAFLCRLLSAYFAVCSADMKGLVESCFFDVWETGAKQVGSVLEFYLAIQEAGEPAIAADQADHNQLRERLHEIRLDYDKRGLY